MDAISPSRWVRAANARVVLEHVWNADAVTGTDLIGVTGLSRATVHDVCEELIDLGWVREVENQREHGDYRKGRPARRYAFDARAGLVVGVDAGEHRVSATVTDLRGELCARASHAPGGGRPSSGARQEIVSRTILDALAEVPAAPSAVLAVAVGVPAPVAGACRTGFGGGNDYWVSMNPGIAEYLTQRHGWTALVENDANLAALAEGWRGHGRGVRSHVTLLAGERLGAGVVDEGRLLRGAHGGAGEMRYLALVDGVGSTAGIAALARDWARAALTDSADGTPSALRDLDPDAVDAEAVFAAARAGDPLAIALVERIGQRMARVVASLASIVDTEQVVLAGRVAASCAPIVDIVTRDLPLYFDDTRPRVLASQLGGEIVAIGAVRAALDHVRRHALDIALPGRSSIRTSRRLPTAERPARATRPG
jgi:predicted NBD/HSP70 family sugar kinase